VLARAAKDAPWDALATSAGGEARLPAGRGAPIDAVRIELELASPATTALVRVAIVPEPDQAAAGR
jgi:hypothetical protein